MNTKTNMSTLHHLCWVRLLMLFLASASGTPITLTSLTPSGLSDGKHTAVWPVQVAETYGLGLFNQPDATTQGVETPYDASVVIT